jgi:type VI protein secretion system component VasK
MIARHTAANDKDSSPVHTCCTEMVIPCTRHFLFRLKVNRKHPTTMHFIWWLFIGLAMFLAVVALVIGIRRRRSVSSVDVSTLSAPVPQSPRISNSPPQPIVRRRTARYQRAVCRRLTYEEVMRQERERRQNLEEAVQTGLYSSSSD